MSTKRCEENIEKYLIQKLEGECVGVIVYDLGKGPVEESCEHGNEISGPPPPKKKFWIFFE
jgi:hypothetical protein